MKPNTKNSQEELEEVLSGNAKDPEENKAVDSSGKVEESKTVAPQTVKVGEQEMTVEQITEATKLKSEVEAFGKEHGDWKSIYPEFTKRSQELKEVKDKLAEIEQHFKTGTETQEELPSDYDQVVANAKKYGLITRDEAKVLQDRVDKLETTTKQKDIEETVSDLKFEIGELVEKNPFVKEKDLIDYMARQAEAGKNLSVDEASKLLYFDQFAKLATGNSGGAVLPVTDTSGKGSIPTGEEEAKGITFENNKVSGAVEEVFATKKIE
jgi:hypothetical protein